MGVEIKKTVDTDAIKKDPRFQKLARKIAFTSFRGFGWLRHFCFSSSEMDLLLAVFEKIYSSDMSKAKSEVKNRLICIISITLSAVMLVCSGLLLFKTKSENSDFDNISSINNPFDIDNKIPDEEISEDIIIAKNAAINDLKRLGLIGDDYLKFGVDDFREIRLSLKNVDLSNSNTVNAICQIYAYELAISDYDISAIDAYYKGIKYKREDRYFKDRDDFIASIGFKDEKEYETFASENIKNKNGEIGIGGSSMYSSEISKLSRYKFKYNNNEKIIYETIRERKKNQNLCMRRKVLGTYTAKKTYR